MKLPSINLNREALSRFDDAVKREWIITNGLGGYASSTVLGLNTRKYHGLLVAAFHPPGDRRVCLAKLDEELVIGSSAFSLGANEFQNGISSQGYAFMREFSVSPFPRYSYVLQNVEVQKVVFMPYKKNATLSTYRILNRNNVNATLRVFPLINWRHIHAVTDRSKIGWEFVQGRGDKESDMQFGVPDSVLMLRATGGHYHADGRWVEKLYYREDAQRGESSLDDCYQPGYFELDVKAQKSADFAIVAVVAGEESEARRAFAQLPTTTRDVGALLQQETTRRENLLDEFYESSKGVSASDWLNWIVLGTDMFMVGTVTDEERYVIAGYHWFEVWGRDAFISLPGLMLVTGRFDDARKLFLSFKKNSSHGLIPNFLPDQTAPPTYNAVDSTLWVVNAVLQYLKYTGDFKFVREQLWDLLKTVVASYVKGTDFNIHVDTDGLLSHGPQLTWMDAMVGGQPVTPRNGKAVEVQALWHNALRIMALLGERFKEKSEAEKYLQLADKTRVAFAEKFWNAEKGCLFDVVDGNSKDDSLRPNQIVATALDFSMLDKAKNEKIVDTIQRELLTPCGLRTLGRNNPNYASTYEGDRGRRDRAYHNGTVWPWLLGPFITAFLKTKGYADNNCAFILNSCVLPLFNEQISRAALGTVNEIFDAEPPFAPRGCVAQAWSLAEPLRAYVEDVMQIRPKYEKPVLQGSA